MVNAHKIILSAYQINRKAELHAYSESLYRRQLKRLTAAAAATATVVAVAVVVTGFPAVSLSVRVAAEWAASESGSKLDKVGMTI